LKETREFEVGSARLHLIELSELGVYQKQMEAAKKKYRLDGS